MQIQLLRCTAENNRINKSDYISDVFAVEGNIIEESSILDPVITLEKVTPPQDNYYNYMYIPAFKRYYFITDITCVYDRMWKISAHVDVLYTYMSEILNNKCIICKSEDQSKSNLYLNDGSFVMDSRKYNTIIKFPGGLSSSGQNILICAGGAS